MGTPTFFGWVKPTLNLKFEDVKDNITLDQALMIKFCDLCMEILAIVGIPMLCIMGPLHWMYGECAGIEDQPLLCHGKADHMSYLSFGNVRNGSWLYFVHGMIVWGVVL